MPIEFSKFIESINAGGNQRLPLVHCTTASSSLEVLTRRSLQPSKCPVYKEDLLYLFYGRPAYKPAAGIAANAIVDLAPVCLVVDPSVIASAVRILPFDSGGYDRYKDTLGVEFKLSEFELGLGQDVPLRLVQAFYETNENYYVQNPTLTESKLSFSRQIPRAYARLINDSSIRAIDDRCGTIEVQLREAVQLKSALKAIVAPVAFFADEEIERAIADCTDVVTLPYKTYGRVEPTGLAHAIYERVESYLTSIGSFA